MLESVTWKIIHMSSASEREELVQRLEEIFGATRFEAIVGSTVKDKYEHLQHPVAGETKTNGIYGCIESHYQSLKELQNAPTDYVGVFEDDAIFTAKKEELEDWLQSLPDDWDIALLGTTEHVRRTKINEQVSRVKRFWGAHAVIFRKALLTNLFDTLTKYMREGPLPIPDWWYAWAIQEHNLIAYAPNPPTRFCHQKDGLVSALTGKIRDPPKQSCPKTDK